MRVPNNAAQWKGRVIHMPTDDSNNIELLKLYWDEWKFRQEGLWKRIIQFMVIIFFTSTLPITINIFSASLPNVSLLIFPAVGILLILFFLWFCLSESIRINSIDAKIKQILQDSYPEKYVKTTLVSLTKRKKGVLPIFRWRMAIWVPVSLSVMQFIVAISMIYFVLTNKLA